MIIVAAALGLVGFVVLFGLAYWQLTAPVVIHVPDGEDPIGYLHTWKRLRWSRRVGRTNLFLMALATGSIIGAIIMAIVASAL
jgi:hypothetical protein